MRVESVQGVPAKIEAVTSDYCLATWARFYIDIWRGNTTMEGLQAIQVGFPGFANRYPSGVGLVTIVEQRAPLPPAPVRNAMAKFLADSASAIKCSAVVFEGEGFSAAAVRGVVTGLTLVARPAYPHKIFATVPQASAWSASSIVQAGEPRVNASEIVTAIAELRTKLTTL